MRDEPELEGTLSPDLVARRDIALRLLPSLRLRSLEDAEEFLVERGLLTILPTTSLPSLFGATDPPADMTARGWARWPSGIWWWDSALAHSASALRLKIMRGTGVVVARRLMPVLDPLCRAELDRADAGEYGEGPARLVRHLREDRPSLLDDLKDGRGWETAELRSSRNRLEKVGVLVTREVEVDAKSGGHRHTSELRRWDQLDPLPSSRPEGLRERPTGLAGLLVAAIRSAVFAPEAEARSWFSWPVPGSLVDALVDGGDVARPVSGYLACSDDP